MSKLTAKKRAALPKSEFALPSKRAFPLSDKNHQRLAISGATRSQHAGNISAATADRIKSEARQKLGMKSKGESMKNVKYGVGAEKTPRAGKDDQGGKGMLAAPKPMVPTDKKNPSQSGAPGPVRHKDFGSSVSLGRGFDNLEKC